MPGHSFRIDADIGRAAGPPAAFYLDDAVFRAVRERVFAPSWQWLGRLDDVREPASAAPRTLLPGLLDEPLLLARDESGTLRCLANVCTHRGMPLVQAPCRVPARQGIRCPYHGRRFDLSGRMTFMPGFEGVSDFPGAADDLRCWPLAYWAGHAFVSLAPMDGSAAAASADFERWISPVVQRLPWLEADTFVHDPARDRDFEFRAHWALYVENYLEGLHIPFLHPGLSQTLDLSGYRYELFDGGNLQTGLAKEGEAAFAERTSAGSQRSERVAAYYFWLFPNLMLNFYPWGLSLNLVQPLAPDRTRVSFRAFVGDAGWLAQGAGGALDQVEQEDEAAVEAVQRHLHSRAWRPGRYSLSHDRGVHQFHRLLAAALASGDDEERSRA